MFPRTIYIYVSEFFLENRLQPKWFIKIRVFLVRFSIDMGSGKMGFWGLLQGWHYLEIRSIVVDISVGQWSNSIAGDVLLAKQKLL